MLRRGEIYLPGEDGPAPALTPDGGRYDPFDVMDMLARDYPLVYLVDLDGVEEAEPQLDFLQELARDATLWVDGGVRTAEQAIDILVTGAQRAVLSSGTLQSPRELRRAWKLSTELAFEVEVGPQGLIAPATWETTDPNGLVSAVRAVGLDHLVLSPREVDPDWGWVRAVATGGPTWVDGTFTRGELGRLRSSGARGGIFHIDELLRESPGLSDPRSDPAASPLRDDDS